MSVLANLREARSLLGVTSEEASDRAALRRAYREAIKRSPPDRDPEGFAKLRTSYELLQKPVGSLAERLQSQVPFAPVPKPRDPVTQGTPRGATAMAFLRYLASRVRLETTDEK